VLICATLSNVYHLISVDGVPLLKSALVEPLWDPLMNVKSPILLRLSRDGILLKPSPSKSKKSRKNTIFSLMIIPDDLFHF